MRFTMKDYFNKASDIRFVFPIDGDCLNPADGVMKNGYLTITAKVEAPENADIYIDGKKAVYADRLYTAEVPLYAYRRTITAEDRKTGKSAKIAVYKLNGCMGKYRISLDDNILFLCDLTKNKDVYTSMFDNPYLAVYKKAHDLYGAKVHINIYYEYNDAADDRATFSGEREYFNLTMMTDRYKDEWKANSDWLKLSFHARANTPDSPYLNTSYERISRDIELVHREIRRFAGEEALSSVTTLHWGASNINGVRALRDHGYKGINGYFTLKENGETLVSYFYPQELVKHIDTRDFWVDNEENIVCSKVDAVLNSYRADTIIPVLEKVFADKHRAGFMDLLIHEQYFYSDYRAYLPDYEEIVLNAAKWLSEHGYTGAHLSEVMFEGYRTSDAPEK